MNSAVIPVVDDFDETILRRDLNFEKETLDLGSLLCIRELRSYGSYV